MQEVKINDFSKIFPLYTGWEHHMALKAAAEGKAAARVWADAVKSPSVAVACFGSRLLIAGNPEDINCRESITDFLVNILLQNQIDRMPNYFMLFWNKPGWKEVLLEVLSTYNPVLREREYYVLDTSCSFNKPLLVDGYEFRFVGKTLFEEREWKNRKALRYEMCSERQDVDDFLMNSFGVCAVNGDEIVGWCLSEYNNSKGCEVGIEVIGGHRRKGIGTALTMALTSEARKRGLRNIGWSCFKDNLASLATACKAGLSKADDYNVIVVQR